MRFRSWLPRAVKLGVVLCHPCYRRALRFGVAASTEHARTPLSYDYRTVLDVGANRGQFALLAAGRFPRAQIVCFEPLDGARATLERVFTDRSHVRIFGTALAASAEASQLFVSRSDDSSSLLSPTELQLAMFSGSEVVEMVQLTTQRLDVVLEHDSLVRPTLLKIDAQGAELEVLNGAAGILDAVDTILVECSFVELYAGQPMADDIIRFLHQRDFRLASVANPCFARRRQLVQADLVFDRADG